jgi:AcrR family transcriptional regulator
MATKSPATKASGRTSARDRLLAAADELFYEEGVNTVGIDRVIERAGVAKASLYSSFGSKDELVRSYLQARYLARRERIEKRLSTLDSPREKLLAIFDVLAEIMKTPGFRGCAFVRAGAETRSEGGVRGVCDDSRAYTSALFLQLSRETGAKNPEGLAQQLVLLYDGALVSAQMDRNVGAAAAARDAAEALFDHAVAKPH